MNEECIIAKVFVIIKPIDENNQEVPDKKRVVRLGDSSIKIFYSNSLDKTYDFDYCFPLDASKSTIFKTGLSEIIDDVVLNNK